MFEIHDFSAATLRVVIIAALSAVGVRAQETAPTTSPTMRVTAAQLRAPTVEVAGETEIPQWVFWKLVRETATASADRAAESQYALNDPANFEFVAEKVRAAVRAAGGNVPDFVDKFVTISTVDHGTASPSCAVLKRLTLNEDAHLIRNPVADGRSPVTEITNAPLKLLEDWVVESSGDFKGVLFAVDPPDAATVESAAKHGVRAIIVRSPQRVGDNDPDSVQYARPCGVLDGYSGVLPLPIVYVSFVNERHISKNLGSAVGIGSLIIQRSSVATDRAAKMLVVSIKGQRPDRRLVVSCGRSSREYGLGVGSRAIDFAAWLEMLRVTASFVARRPNLPPLATVDFVFLADAGNGFEFLEKLIPSTGQCLGVLDVANVAPSKAKSDSIFLTLLSDRGTSVLESAFCGILSRWLGRESAWRACGFRLSEPKDWPKVTRSLGHERIPFVALSGSSGGAPMAAEEHPLVVSSMRALKEIDGVSLFVGTSADELSKLVDTNVSHTCMVVRAGIFGILRTMRTEF